MNQLQRHRFEVLDGFRGIAALMVAIFHLNVNGYLSHLYLIKNSWLFVDFFFVLSGFIIGYGYLDKIYNFSDLRVFILKRIARIYPLHLFMLLLFIPFGLVNLIVGVNLGERFSFSSFIQNIFLIQALGFNNQETWNVPAWSISVEFYAYILFSLISLYFPFYKNKILFLSFLSFLSFFILYYFSTMSDTVEFSFFRCTFSFFLGVVAFLIFKKFNYNLKPWIELLIFALVIFYLSSDFIYSSSYKAFLSPLLFFVVILVFSKEKGLISTILKCNLFQFLGKLSFSIYLTHSFFVTIIKSIVLIIEKNSESVYLYEINQQKVLDFGWGGINDLIFLPYLVVIIIFSFFTYKYIEIYFQKKIISKLIK